MIIGARLGEREHRGDNLAVFGFALDDADTARLDRGAIAAARDSRRLRRRIPQAAVPHRVRRSESPPGRALPRVFHASAGLARPGRTRGRLRQPLGADRRLRARGAGRPPDPRQRHDGDARREHHGVSRRCRGQTVYVLDKIGAAIEALGGELDDVVRTRIYVRDAKCAEAGRARPRPLLRRGAAGQHAGGDRRTRSAATRSRSKPRRRSIREPEKVRLQRITLGSARRLLPRAWSTAAGCSSPARSATTFARTRGRRPPRRRPRCRSTSSSARCATPAPPCSTWCACAPSCRIEPTSKRCPACSRSASAPRAPRTRPVCSPLAVDEAKVEIEVTALKAQARRRRPPSAER